MTEGSDAYAHPPVTGQPDVWNPMITRTAMHAALTRLHLTRSTTPQSTTSDGATPDGATPRRKARLLPVAAAAVALLLVGGTTAVARAHKTVELDVDGKVTQLSTFAGSVQGVLDAQQVSLSTHDSVTPAATTGLQNGDTVVVRHGHQVDVVIDGKATTVWTTALAVGEALTTLSARGGDVSIVAGRSESGGRPELPLRLAVTGTVDVVADGVTHTVDKIRNLEGALSAAGVKVGAQDRVGVALTGADGRVTVTVRRVVTAEETSLTPIAFTTTTQKTSSLPSGVTRTSKAGVAGELTTTYRVVRVDGAEESRVELSHSVTREPVAKVVQVGTGPKPTVAATTGAVGGDVWAALARCESGGNPLAVSSNGLYYGLYQFSLGTWSAMGGSGLPTNASAAEQTQRAQALQARSGWGQWPACSSALGLR